MTRPPDSPTPAAVLAEIVLLGAGLTVALLPLLILAVPGVILFVVLPAILLLIPLATPVVAAAVLIAPPYLVVRWIRRCVSRAPTASPATTNATARWRAVAKAETGSWRERQAG